MIKDSMYRDGGTMEFTGFFNVDLNITPEMKFCRDGRIGSKTVGKWFLGYPDKEDSRPLTEEERKYIANEVILHLSKDYKRAKARLDMFMKENPDCLFKLKFHDKFSFYSGVTAGGESKYVYKDGRGYKIVEKKDKCILFDEDNFGIYEGTIQQVFGYYMRNCNEK